MRMPRRLQSCRRSQTALKSCRHGEHVNRGSRQTGQSACMCHSSLFSNASGGMPCQPQASAHFAGKNSLTSQPATPCSLDAQEREYEHTKRARHAALSDAARLVSPDCLLVAVRSQRYIM